MAIYRSQAVLGQQIYQLQATVTEEGQPGGNATDLRVAQLQLAQAQTRLNARESIDRTVAIAAPLLEPAVSWAPVFAAELLVLLSLNLRVRRHQRRETALTSQINQLNLDLRG
jgi:hypothetical protein